MDKNELSKRPENENDEHHVDGYIGAFALDHLDEPDENPGYDVTADDETFFGNNKDIYMSQVRRTQLPSREENLELYARFEDEDEEAKAQIIEASLRWVIKVAQQYKGRGLSELDLIQAGNIGLMKAIEKFDRSKEVMFNTYATWWIHQSIGWELNYTSSTIRIPVNKSESISKMVRVSEAMKQELDRDPTAEEVAGRLGITPGEVLALEAARSVQKVLSIDMPISGDTDVTLADFIEDTPGLSMEDEVVNESFNQDVRNILAILTPRERKVIEQRFGLNGYQQGTLEEVGQELGVTRERIRQIEKKALQKLGKHPSINQLRELLD